MREEREKESIKYQGTWAESDDEDGQGPLDLGFVPPPVRVSSGNGETQSGPPSAARGAGPRGERRRDDRDGGFTLMRRDDRDGGGGRGGGGSGDGSGRGGRGGGRGVGGRQGLGEQRADDRRGDDRDGGLLRGSGWGKGDDGDGGRGDRADRGGRYVLLLCVE